MRRLTKRDVETMMRGYDADPVAALTVALRRTLEMAGDAAPDWADLLAAAPLPDDRREALVRGDQAALDDLAAELNEERRLGN